MSTRALPLRAPSPTPVFGTGYLPDQTVELPLADVESETPAGPLLVDARALDPHAARALERTRTPNCDARYLPDQTVELSLVDVESVPCDRRREPRVDASFPPNQTIERSLADVESVSSDRRREPRVDAAFPPNQTIEISLADVETVAFERASAPGFDATHPPNQTVEVCLADIESETPSEGRVDGDRVRAFDPRETLALPREARAVSSSPSGLRPNRRAVSELGPPETLALQPGEASAFEPRETLALQPGQAPAFNPRSTLALEPAAVRAVVPNASSRRAKQRLPVIPPFVATPVDDLARALATPTLAAGYVAPTSSRVSRSAPGKLAGCDLCTRVIPHRPTLPTPDAVVVRRFVCDATCVKPRAPYRHACPPARTNPFAAAVLFVLLAIASAVITLASGLASADAREGVEMRDAYGDVGHAPAVRDVLAAAYRTAGLDTNVGRGFAARARLAALVPWLSVRTARDTNWRDGETDVSRGTTVEVRATWRLDRLVFEGRELQVVSVEAARRRERRKLGQQVVRVYFTWKRAVRAAGLETGDPAGAMARAEEAAAELDDLTGGWFSEELAGR